MLQGGLDAIRSRVLTLIGERIDLRLGPDVYTAVADLPLRSDTSGQETLQPFRDLEASAASCRGAVRWRFFDMPWLPIYLLLCYLFHPLLGYAAMSAAVILIVHHRSRRDARREADAPGARSAIASAICSPTTPIKAPRSSAPWACCRHWPSAGRRRNCATSPRSAAPSFVVGGLSAMAKMTRMLVQSCMLGLGAYLAIKNEISAGTIIATSILASRALAPVDQAIASWRGFVAARHGYARLRKLLDERRGSNARRPLARAEAVASPPRTCSPARPAWQSLSFAIST